MAEPKPGAYPRVNGGMIQTGAFNETIVSIVGKLIDQSTFQTADGTNITLNTAEIVDGVMVNPDMAVEIIGLVNDQTTVTVRYC